MPVKPKQSILDLAHKQLDPKDVLTVVINEAPEVRKALYDADLLECYDEESGKWLRKSEGGKLGDD